MSDALVDAYRDLRGRVLDMTADLPAEEAERIVPCCPEWSVRDLLCHMAGVPAHIVAGNTAEAATVAWADAHVSNRAGWDLERIRAELDDAGRQVDEVIAAAGERFPGPFFIDAWSHEADLATSTTSSRQQCRTPRRTSTTAEPEQRCPLTKSSTMCSTNSGSRRQQGQCTDDRNGRGTSALRMSHV